MLQRNEVLEDIPKIFNELHILLIKNNSLLMNAFNMQVRLKQQKTKNF